MTWSNTYSAFVQNGQSFGGINLNFTNEVQAAYRETGISASMSTILADLYIVCVIPLEFISISSPLFFP